MKVVCCDTSFLFALYCQDRHTQPALKLAGSLKNPIACSVLNEYELENAFRFAGWRQLISSAEVEACLNAFAADKEIGRLVWTTCDLPAVLVEARRLSAAYVLSGGHRVFDILHIAVAVHLQAQEFLSFDSNQRDLARKAGLKINA